VRFQLAEKPGDEARKNKKEKTEAKNVKSEVYVEPERDCQA
jgi:hypothetical protein